MWQSCAHARIECGNPVPTPGLTAGRVSGEKTLCQRYCEDSIASGGFFGQNRKLKRSRKTDLGVERSRNPDLGKKNPDLGAGSDAGRAMPGSWGLAAIGKKSCRSSPRTTTGEDWILFFPGMPGRLGYAGQVRRNCRLRRQFRNFFPGKNPDLGAGSDAGQARPVAR